MLLVECTADHCPAGDACQNQRFQRQTFPQTSLLETPGRGLGLVADGTIEPGTVVAEYTGEVILETEAEKRARVRSPVLTRYPPNKQACLSLRSHVRFTLR